MNLGVEWRVTFVQNQIVYAWDKMAPILTSLAWLLRVVDTVTGSS